MRACVCVFLAVYPPLQMLSVSHLHQVNSLYRLLVPRPVLSDAEKKATARCMQKHPPHTWRSHTLVVLYVLVYATAFPFLLNICVSFQS